MSRKFSRKGHTELSSNYFYSVADDERIGSHYLLEVRLDNLQLTKDELHSITDELFKTYMSIKKKLGLTDE